MPCQEQLGGVLYGSLGPGVIRHAGASSQATQGDMGFPE